MSRFHFQASLQLSFILMISTACGVLPIVDSQTQFALDGVKLVKADHDSPADASLMGQREYEIGPSARLLVRFEDLSRFSSEIRTEGGRAVEVMLTPVVSNPADLESVSPSLRLCALTRNWMMLATWKRSHPFDASGKWTTPGGDYDSELCFGVSKIEEQRLIFDVTPWVIQFLRARGLNYGFVVIASANVRIFGDGSGLHAPQIRWVKSFITPIPLPTTSSESTPKQ